MHVGLIGNFIRTELGNRLFPSSILSANSSINKNKHVQNSFKRDLFLENQQEVYLVQDDVGVFLPKQKDLQVFKNASMAKKLLHQTLETKPH